MQRKNAGTLEKVTIRLWSDDMDFFREKFPTNHNSVIRRIVGNWVIRNRSRKDEKQT